MRGVKFVINNINNKTFNPHYVFSARITDLTVGRCNVNVSKDVAYLNYIYIEPVFRNRSLGSRLLMDTEDFLWNNNVSFINSHVLSNDSYNLIDFYIKNNYNIIHRTDNAFDDGENIFDMIHMNKIKDMDDNEFLIR